MNVSKISMNTGASFKAQTKISASETMLSKEDREYFEKLGSKVGTDSDTIEIAIGDLTPSKMNPSVFDNSWDIYAQDIPSAEYFLKNGICNIIVRGDCIQKDLKKILYPFQLKGINIFLADEYENPKAVRLKKTRERNV